MENAQWHQYGGIEYGGFSVKVLVICYWAVLHRLSLLTRFASLFRGPIFRNDVVHCGKDHVRPVDRC
jgi:hypothetical protein